MALDRYHLAVLALANSTEDWKSRLCNAVNQIFPIHPFELPEGLRERHASLLKSGTFLPGDNGAINATVFQLKQKAGRAAIGEIIAIWTELRLAEQRDREMKKQ